jgi:hypothetical protein
MPGKRKEAQQYILDHIEKLAPGGENKQLYADKFSKMDDAQFEAMVLGLEDGTISLAVIVPNFSKIKINVQKNLALAEEMGHQFFQRIQMPAKDGMPAYLTPIPYLVIDLPVRRQAQLLEKKISIPEDNNSIDDFTGQPTGKSKGSRVSYPEIQVLAALGLNDSLTEFLKYRGGDEKGFVAMNTMLSRTGGVSQKAIEPYAGGVKATATMSAYLTAMHLKNTLV